MASISPPVWALLLLSGGIAATANAQGAETYDARLEFRSSERCPDEEAFRALVVGRLGRTPFQDTAARTVRVTIDEVDEGFRAILETPARRELVSPRCDDIAAASAVVVALALDAPPAETRSRSTEWRGELSPGALRALEALDREPPPRLAPAPQPVDAPDAGWRMSGGGDLALGGGVIPSVALGGVLSLGMERHRFLLRIEAQVMASASTSTRADVRGILSTGGIAPCAVLEPVLLCGVVSAGVVATRANQVVEPTWKFLAFASAGLRVGARWTSGGLQLSAFLQGEVPLRRPLLRVGDETVWESSPVAGLLAFGIAWRP